VEVAKVYQILMNDMTALIRRLCAMPSETEWIEFKVNNDAPDGIGEYISALSNAARLHHQEKAYLVWGIEDKTHHIVGTDFLPIRSKVGNEDLESWLIKMLSPRLDFRFYNIEIDNKFIVLLEIPASHTPVSWKNERYIRVGSYCKKLKEYPEKEGALWQATSQYVFERGLAQENINVEDIHDLLDVASYFRLSDQHVPQDAKNVIDVFNKDGLLHISSLKEIHLTNLGAILLSLNLDNYHHLKRKALRVITYAGNNKISGGREKIFHQGYASSFENIIDYIHSQLPINEHIEQALRVNRSLYPDLAIRELVANLLLHQDFSMTGTGPIVEIFSDRLEFTNPGVPLIDPLRFVNDPPHSRNDELASLSRRFGMCEERGSGFDKVVFQCELFQLPAPQIEVTDNHTKVILYAPKSFRDMSVDERIRACYWHACLLYAGSSNKAMTNMTLRERFHIEAKNYPMISLVIQGAIKAQFIRMDESGSKSKRDMRYLPAWA
jgi:ATP-dependent DNA helicase RecG